MSEPSSLRKRVEAAATEECERLYGGCRCKNQGENPFDVPRCQAHAMVWLIKTQMTDKPRESEERTTDVSKWMPIGSKD